jgi:hypothetical protein
VLLGDAQRVSKSHRVIQKIFPFPYLPLSCNVIFSLSPALANVPLNIEASDVLT